ncbi:DUF447 domain-containing protein [Phyllobacterium endophyticum]|uniref:DUF447 domain-containing protein n=1 Tax=Phyllobacterium endophyticum TaxID=1149773 RepID=A0A2P7AM73_9HYPH|nr:DUF447 domain-containing protein [Phyllobacterium endophyticum]MBB3238475.1 hypothetical protein [Phyllobacterium endophyticum]PSH55323.1 DUF447 domain-containing protein [Phyllobacterium endophyticum]TYR43141.1 DUF447 family protein [Phyllobacterium endophyticum]
MTYIRETIVTTVDAKGVAHIAPLGIIQQDHGWVIAPFRPSKTLENLAAIPFAIANYTDDVLIFAGCLTGRKEWPTVAVKNCPVPRLEAALSHSVLEVVSVDEDALRPRHLCKVVSEKMHAPFTGLNRAKAAVLELAILVSRLSMLPPEKVEAEVAYLAIALEKTGGPDELQAWSWLMEKVRDHQDAADAKGKNAVPHRGGQS